MGHQLAKVCLGQVRRRSHFQYKDWEILDKSEQVGHPTSRKNRVDADKYLFINKNNEQSAVYIK